MALLGARLYDPAAAAVVRPTTANLAMTAVDSTNLRIGPVTVPANGAILVQMECVLHGAATFPQILLGVMTTAGVVMGRVSPVVSVGGTALATTMADATAEFVVPGLTPGSQVTWDACYGVEFFVASTGIKYGGPNNTTASDAFGAFCYSLHSI